MLAAMRAALLLLILGGCFLLGFRAWTKAQYVPADEVRAGLQAWLADVRRDERAAPVTTPEGDAILERALRAASIFDDAIDGELRDDLSTALSKRWKLEEWSQMTAKERELIVEHPPVKAALARWLAGDPFAEGRSGQYGSLPLLFQLVWVGDDVAPSEAAPDAGILAALEVVQELFAAQDDYPWLEGSRILGWLVPRLESRLEEVSAADRERASVLAESINDRLPSKRQFLVSTQIETLEEALKYCDATGPDAPKLVNTLHNSAQTLQALIPELEDLADQEDGTEEERRVREARIQELNERYDELPLEPSVLAVICLNAVQAADACHRGVDGLLSALKK
jgi:signal transduction histidine kinase